MTDADRREAERLDGLIERTANWLMQGRDGGDSEGEAAAWQYLDQLKRQRAALRPVCTVCLWPQMLKCCPECEADWNANTANHLSCETEAAAVAL